MIRSKFSRCRTLTFGSKLSFDNVISFVALDLSDVTEKKDFVENILARLSDKSKEEADNRRSSGDSVSSSSSDKSSNHFVFSPAISLVKSRWIGCVTMVEASRHGDKERVGLVPPPPPRRVTFLGVDSFELELCRNIVLESFSGVDSRSSIDCRETQRACRLSMTTSCSAFSRKSVSNSCQLLVSSVLASPRSFSSSLRRVSTVWCGGVSGQEFMVVRYRAIVKKAGKIVSI